MEPSPVLETTGPSSPASLHVRTRPRPVTRLNRRVVVGGGIIGVGLVTLLLVQGLHPPQRAPLPGETPAPARAAAYPDFLTFGPKSYTELAPQGQVAPPPPSGGTQAEAPVVPPPPAAALAPPPPAAAPAGGAPGLGGRPTPAPRSRAVPRVPAPPPPPPSPWLFADLKQGGVQEPPFPVPPVAAPAPGSPADRLFPQAVWGTPVDPTQVLYRSQVIPGLLQHDVHSDQPGLIRILVTEAVQDRFGQGRTLLPQYSLLLGRQDGTVVFGQARLGITIDSAELPDGTVVAFNKAKVADATGATGVTGAVNNHWVHVGIGAVLTAVLSVGSRAAAGSPTGFQPTLSQEFAKDVSQSVHTTGQQIVRRSLEVAPTITIPHGTPVTVQLSEPISFQTPAARVRP